MSDSQVDLSAEEYRRIFEHRIVPTLDLTNQAAPARPVALLLGGQPGAGKTHHLAASDTELRATGRTWVINGDDMYAFHPEHNNLIAKHGSVTALEMLKPAASAWIRLALTEAQKRKVNIIMETTMRQPAVVKAQAAEFRGNGYRVHAKVMAVPAEESLLANRERYERQHEMHGAARLTPRTIHDEAYRNLLTTVRQLEQGRGLDRIEVVTRGSDRPAYRNDLVDGEWKRAPAADDAIRLERDRPWPSGRVQAYRAQWDAVEKRVEARCVRLTLSPAERAAELQTVHAERTNLVATAEARQSGRSRARSGLIAPLHAVPKREPPGRGR